MEFSLESTVVTGVGIENFRGVSTEPFRIEFFPVVGVDEARKTSRIKKNYLRYNRHNLMIYGGNGAGKSTIADALAFYFDVPIQRYGKKLKLGDLAHGQEPKGHIEVRPANTAFNSKMGFSKGKKRYKTKFENNTEDFAHFRNYMKEHTMLITYEILQRLISYSKGTEFFTLDFYLLNQMTDFYKAAQNLKNIHEKFGADFGNNESELNTIDDKFRELINKEGLYPEDKRGELYENFKAAPEEAKKTLEDFRSEIKDGDRRLPEVEKLINRCNRFIELKKAQEKLKEILEINEGKTEKIYSELVLPKVTKIEKEATGLLNNTENFSESGLEIKIENRYGSFVVSLVKKGKPLELSKINEGLTTLISTCIYLAIAKDLEVSLLILDDILLSVFDYKMDIFDLLTKDFRDVQTILLTHDRVFYNTIRNYVSIEGIKTWNFIKLYKKSGLMAYRHENDGYDRYIEESLERGEHRTALFYIRMELEKTLKSKAEKLKLKTQYKNDKIDHLLQMFIDRANSNGDSTLKSKLDKFRLMYDSGALNPAAHSEIGVDLYREEVSPKKIWKELKELKDAF